ncbi:hypothetical protein BKA70DRAFT_59170 [Coprinopsis sp. MPI-PUGE-AT-0042]|nr:hypothetical protein BKA70DRAFT_59170 [Coprinopsis sp. MPI-PUGE-AT-0042]
MHFSQLHLVFLEFLLRAEDVNAPSQAPKLLYPHTSALLSLPDPVYPSLSTLAKMNVVLTKKVRKGRVGAGLPFEPWDTLESNEEEDEEGERQPTRVLQDVNGKETASLPAGMQPLLPSQLLQMSTSSSSAAYVSHQSSISTPSLPVATTNIAAAALKPCAGFQVLE